MAILKKIVSLEQYHDPEKYGSYGGILRFAKENGIKICNNNATKLI